MSYSGATWAHVQSSLEVYCGRSYFLHILACGIGCAPHEHARPGICHEARLVQSLQLAAWEEGRAPAKMSACEFQPINISL
jgi:hypothetical protein